MSALDVKAINPILKKVYKDKRRESLHQKTSDSRRFQKLRAAIKKTRKKQNHGK